MSYTDWSVKDGDCYLTKNQSKPENAKEVIMDTAIRVFSKKGFDGARVDEIAVEAGVPKSLIYYYFKGKEHLLQELLSRFFKKYDQVLRIKEPSVNGKNKYLNFLEENDDLLRIVIIESLKKDSRLAGIFNSVEKLMEYEQEIDGEKETSNEERHKRLVVEFFTNLLPGVGLICYKDNWCEYFHVDAGTLYRDFGEAIEKTHGAYHKGAK